MEMWKISRRRPRSVDGTELVEDGQEMYKKL